MFSFDHANLNVTNLECSIKFYEQALGLTLCRRIDAPDGAFSIVFLQSGQSGFPVELTWLKDKEGPYELGDNEAHLAFTTPDMDKAHALHEQMGCICFENKNMGIYFIEDPDGYWLEIMPEKADRP